MIVIYSDIYNCSLLPYNTKCTNPLTHPYDLKRKQTKLLKYNLISDMEFGQLWLQQYKSLGRYKVRKSQVFGYTVCRNVDNRVRNVSFLHQRNIYIDGINWRHELHILWINGMSCTFCGLSQRLKFH